MGNPTCCKISETSADLDHVVVGRVVSAWGLRGGVHVESHTDSETRFLTGGSLYLNGQVARILRSRVNGTRVSLEVDVVTDRDKAESLVGTLITVPVNSIEELPEGSYYHFQIIGIEVWTKFEERLGLVKQILRTGSNDVYIVRDGVGKETLVPALRSFILEIDMKGNRMVVELDDNAR